MTTTHEGGHIVGGMACGATLVDYDLAPCRMPYSLHSPDPRPLMTLWAGPLLGVLIPVSLAALIRERWAWFIADFCVVANGGYLALAWMSGDRFLDTPRLLEAGVNPALIMLYCSVTIGAGYVRFRSDCIHFLRRSPAHPNDGEHLYGLLSQVVQIFSGGKSM
ncbi:hypothetical protein [Candidatus Laterigemmans baculatus]|uniref:hypothetical protein n=1 Tax=Candidatus Laterigemmans baculatus TaxID=2770505 RepID=UPI001F1D177E|nr:hypothetical protein [Candidatus Laterigemmans baculatus]